MLPKRLTKKVVSFYKEFREFWQNYLCMCVCPLSLKKSIIFASFHFNILRYQKVNCFRRKLCRQKGDVDNLYKTTVLSSWFVKGTTKQLDATFWKTKNKLKKRVQQSNIFAYTFRELLQRIKIFVYYRYYFKNYFYFI